jgi:hypothetical protein
MSRIGERLNDGLSALAVGEGPPLVVLPGLGQGADLSVRVPRTAALSATALARGFGRTVHLIHRPVSPPPGMTIAGLAGWHATALRDRFGEPVDVMGTSGGGVHRPSAGAGPSPRRAAPGALRRREPRRRARPA